ncbi:MAG TPA: hypothetical protein VFE05_17875 [Longimicrobiaceae bacterium]|jgi:hypothetical protein|nr:hypothetical protein [Longimicrobiaceae bacterium]
MNRYVLDPNELHVESFVVRQPVRSFEPATYETDAEHLSICLVSCGGSCGDGCIATAV